MKTETCLKMKLSFRSIKEQTRLLSMKSIPRDFLDRRSFFTKTLGIAGASAAGALGLRAADPGDDYLKEVEENERKARSKDSKATIGIGDKLKITKVETIFVKPRW